MARRSCMFWSWRPQQLHSNPFSYPLMIPSTLVFLEVCKHNRLLSASWLLYTLIFYMGHSLSTLWMTKSFSSFSSQLKYHFPGEDFLDHPIKSRLVGLPWWRSGWESACQYRGHGFDPWSGRIPHAAEQLGPWATTTEPAHLEPVLCNKRGRDSERPMHRDEEWPPLATTRESPRTETKTQHSQK